VRIEIKSWRDGRVLYSGEHESLRGAVETAVACGTSLAYADLARASLAGASLAHARLVGADLAGASLAGANLVHAQLAYADLDGTSLAGANLDRANLAGANLDATRDDVRALVAAAPKESPALLVALRAGRVNGSCYTGECACLCGTIAKSMAGRVLDTFDDVAIVLGEMLRTDQLRPAERWALAIRQGDTPETSPVVALTARWIEEWIAEQAVRS
jgi:hypothetical protein